MSHSEVGTTIVEATIVCALTMVLSATIIQTLRSTSATTAVAEGQLRAASLAARVVQRIDDDIKLGVHLFEEEELSRAYLERMQGLDTACQGNRLPVDSVLDVFAPDPAATIETGNMLLLVRTDRYELLDLSADESGDWHRVDRVRFVVYFLSANASGALDLCRWESEPIAKHGDVASVGEPERRARLHQALEDVGFRFVWDLRAKCADAKPDKVPGLLRLEPDGKLEPVSKKDKLAHDARTTELGILSRRHMRVAPNGVPPPLSVPAYATAAEGFPGGFEVKLIDDGRSSLVFVRLAIESANGRPGHAVVQREISVRAQ